MVTTRMVKQPLIDPSAYVAVGALVMGDVHLGKDSSVWYQAVLRGDADEIRIGQSTNIQDMTMVHADPGMPCIVGDRVTVGHRAILHGCRIEDDCLIGMGAILMNGVKIGAGSVVGAGALLLEGMEVPPGSLVVGSPARVLRLIGESAKKQLDQAWRHYCDLARRHRAGDFPPFDPSSPA